jgi:hypothetical protein
VKLGAACRKRFGSDVLVHADRADLDSGGIRNGVVGVILQGASMVSRSDPRPPWKRKNPKKHSKRLSPEQKAEARARARAAGRKYPNLVDNMAVARKRKKKKKKQ